MKKYLQWIFPAALIAAPIVWAHEGHEHVATDPTKVQWGLQGAMELINVHPLFVHFPIALLMVCVFFYAAGLIFKKENLLIAGKWSLYLGTLSAASAVWTGLLAAGSVKHSGDTHQIMMVHQYLGITVLALSAVLSIWVLISKANTPKAPKFFFLALLLLAALITQQADFGGRLVFLHGVGVGKKSMMQEQGHGGETMGGHEEGDPHGDHQH